MRVLNIAPEAQWIKFDDDLSLRIRRITVHESHDIVQGTVLARLFSGEADDGAMKIPEGELLDLCDRIFATMVVGWTVQDAEGGDIAVEKAAWRWLLTETPHLIGWLVNVVYLGVTRSEAEIELEKGD